MRFYCSSSRPNLKESVNFFVVNWFDISRVILLLALNGWSWDQNDQWKKKYIHYIVCGRVTYSNLEFNYNSLFLSSLSRSAKKKKRTLLSLMFILDDY
jgi:hypothetical protein